MRCYCPTALDWVGRGVRFLYKTPLWGGSMVAASWVCLYFGVTSLRTAYSAVFPGHDTFPT